MVRGGRTFGIGVLLVAVGCSPGTPVDGVGLGGAGQAAGAGGVDVPSDAGAGGGSGTSTAGSAGSSGVGGSDATPQGGAGGAEEAGSGGSDANHGGAGGTDVAPQGGSSQGGAGGSEVNQGGSDQGGAGGVDQGGAGGADVGEGGSEGGTGGSDVGQGGSGQGGAGGSDVEPEPECSPDFSRCDGNVYEECDGGVFLTYACTAETGLNCYPGEGCYGDCFDGDTRCTGDSAETCVHGDWTVTEACAFQCVAGACEGACTPGAVVCGDGASLLTCGSDFHFGAPVACPTDPNATASCSDGECSLTPIACGAGTADCDGDWSCEADLSSIETCGSCATACDPNPDNASPTCTVSGCGFSCDDGFADCDGDPTNGCEQNIATDALNCGACGNSCYGTSCGGGECAYDFEVVSDYSGQSAVISDVVVTDTYVYWQTQTELRRAPKAGGAYETFATLVGQPSVFRAKTGIVVDGGVVAWVTQDGIYVKPEAGGTETRILQTPTNSTQVHGLVLANGKLYWNDSLVEVGDDCITQQTLNNQNAFLACSQGHVTTIRSYDLTTHATSGIELSGEYSTPLGVHGDELYIAHFAPNFPDGHADYEIRFKAYDVTTGDFLREFGGRLWINGGFNAANAILHGTSINANTLVYSALLDGPGTSAPTSLVTAPLSGTDSLATNTQIASLRSTEFVADGSAVYYRSGETELHTGVRRISLTGQTLAPIFENETFDYLQVAGDDTYIYFTASTNGGERAILRAPK